MIGCKAALYAFLAGEYSPAMQSHVDPIGWLVINEIRGKKSIKVLPHRILSVILRGMRCEGRPAAQLCGPIQQWW